MPERKLSCSATNELSTGKNINLVVFSPRSLPGQSSHRQPREQLNQNTAFMDASHLYGSDPCRARDLRTFGGGRMKTMRHPGSRVFKDLMPRTRQNPECHSPIGRCFHTGMPMEICTLKYITQRPRLGCVNLHSRPESRDGWMRDDAT